MSPLPPDFYAILEVPFSASSSQIKTSYTKRALQTHPDKGGDPSEFHLVRLAFETLSDKSRRAVYDSIDFPRIAKLSAAARRKRKEATFSAADQDEDEPATERDKEEMIDRLSRMWGAKGIDPRQQLVCLCGICARPSAKTCWICKMALCEYCTLKVHHQDGHPPHYPLINAATTTRALAHKELEAKRKEDARLLEASVEGFRTQKELRILREFKDAAIRNHFDPQAGAPDAPLGLAMSRWYLWTATDRHVYVACYLPVGDEAKALFVGIEDGCLVIQSEGAPPVLRRRLAPGVVDLSRPPTTIVAKNRRFCTVTLKRPTDTDESESDGESDRLPLERLFQGDPSFARKIDPPYAVHVEDGEVLLEMPLPFFTEEEDVQVDAGPRSLEIRTRQGFHLQKRLWIDRAEQSRRGPGAPELAAIQPENVQWTLEAADRGPGRTINFADKILTVFLPRPSPTVPATGPSAPSGGPGSDRLRRRGWDHREKQRTAFLNAPAETGVQFFEEDEDEFGLEDRLLALVFLECGAVHMPRKPWESDRIPRPAQASGAGSAKSGRLITSLRALPPAVRSFAEAALAAAVEPRPRP